MILLIKTRHLKDILIQHKHYHPKRICIYLELVCKKSQTMNIITKINFLLIILEIAKHEYIAKNSTPTFSGTISFENISKIH